MMRAFTGSGVRRNSVAPRPKKVRGWGSKVSANAGRPALTVPGGLAEGENGALPFGVEFIGAEGADGLLFALGQAFEAARGPMPPAPV